MSIATDVGHRPSSVHLRLRGPVGEHELMSLRRQLAACLCSGVTDVSVHVEHGALDAAAAQALNGAGVYLRRRGGSLTVVHAAQEQLA